MENDWQAELGSREGIGWNVVQTLMAAALSIGSQFPNLAERLWFRPS
jgi:hypothetical protein